MKHFVRWPQKAHSAGLSNTTALTIAAIVLGCLAVPDLGELSGAAHAGDLKPNLYVPYEGLPHLIEPADKAVLMDRAQFENLLAAAEKNARDADTIELGHTTRAEYSGTISGEQLTLTGKLDVVSAGNGPLAVPLGFAGIGLKRVTLNGAPAPLGYDKKGRLTLILPAKGTYQLEIAGTTKLHELQPEECSSAYLCPKPSPDA